jgi:hypothetical protein
LNSFELFTLIDRLCLHLDPFRDHKTQDTQATQATEPVDKTTACQGMSSYGTLHAPQKEKTGGNSAFLTATLIVADVVGAGHFVFLFL